MKLNAEWHKRNTMPNNPTIQQCSIWHLEHAKECGCRPIPLSVQKYLKDEKKL